MAAAADRGRTCRIGTAGPSGAARVSGADTELVELLASMALAVAARG